MLKDGVQSLKRDLYSSDSWFSLGLFNDDGEEKKKKSVPPVKGKTPENLGFPFCFGSYMNKKKGLPACIHSHISTYIN